MPLFLKEERPGDSVLEKTNMFRNPSEVRWTRV